MESFLKIHGAIKQELLQISKFSQKKYSGLGSGLHHGSGSSDIKIVTYINKKMETFVCQKEHVPKF